MKLNYKNTIKPTVAESKIVSCTSNESIFFIYKEDGYIDYKVTINKDLIVDGYVDVKESTESNYILESNTTNVIGSNIVIDDLVYFYKVYVLGSTVNLKDLLLNSLLGIKYFKGSYYTNQIINNYELFEGVYVYSKPVFDKNYFNVDYSSNKIYLQFNKTDKEEVFFKTRYDLNIQPNFISNSKIYFDNVLITKDREKHLCKEGDIRLFDKIEYNSNIGNSISCKDLIYSCDKFYTDCYNKLYTDKYYYEFEVRPFIKYKAKTSTHVFNIKDELHFKITSFGLSTIDDKEDSDFTVTKIIDYSKINIIFNNYLNNYKNVLNSFEYCFSSKLVDDNSKIGLKELKIVNLHKYPSQRYYIRQNDCNVFQHTNNTFKALQVPVIQLNVEKFNYKSNSNIYKNYKGVKILGTTYFKMKQPYSVNLSTENTNPLEIEDTNKLIIEG